jgi:hypothetical protein
MPMKVLGDCEQPNNLHIAAHHLVWPSPAPTRPPHTTVPSLID